MSIFYNANILASYLVCILGIILPAVFLIANLSKDKIENKKYLLFVKFYSFFLVSAISCTQSRNGLIAFIFMITLSILLAKKDKLLLLIILLSGLFSFFFIKHIIFLRLINGDIHLSSINLKMGVVSPFGIDSRTVIWNYAIKLFQQKPLFGWGLGSYKLLYPIQKYGNPMHPHNLWLMLLSELGLFGAISLNLLIGIIFFRFTYALRKLTTNERYIILSCFISFLGSMMFHMFDIVFFDFRINIINWINLSVIYSLSFRAIKGKF